MVNAILWTLVFLIGLPILAIVAWKMLCLLGAIISDAAGLIFSFIVVAIVILIACLVL